MHNEAFYGTGMSAFCSAGPVAWFINRPGINNIGTEVCQVSLLHAENSDLLEMSSQLVILKLVKRL